MVYSQMTKFTKILCHEKLKLYVYSILPTLLCQVWFSFCYSGTILTVKTMNLLCTEFLAGPRCIHSSVCNMWSLSMYISLIFHYCLPKSWIFIRVIIFLNIPPLCLTKIHVLNTKMSPKNKHTKEEYANSMSKVLKKYIQYVNEIWNLKKIETTYTTGYCEW